MNREDIIRMAREAGFVVDEASRQHQPKCMGFTHYLIDDELERFAALVAAHVREDDITLMARKAGIANWHKDLKRWVFEPGPERFAVLVAAAEREACAELCERMASRTRDIRSAALEMAAENIRARGGK